MTWKIKIKGEKYIAEVLSDDLKTAIFKADLSLAGVFALSPGRC